MNTILDLMNPVNTMQPVTLSAGQHVRLGQLNMQQTAVEQPLLFVGGHVLGLGLMGALIGFVASKSKRKGGPSAKAAVAAIGIGSTLTAATLWLSPGSAQVPMSLKVGETVAGLGALAYTYSKY